MFLGKEINKYLVTMETLEDSICQRRVELMLTFICDEWMYLYAKFTVIFYQKLLNNNKKSKDSDV